MPCFLETPVLRFPLLPYYRRFTGISLAVACLAVRFKVSFLTSFYIQFHWRLESSNSIFQLVNILLLKFHTLSRKKIKLIKTRILWWKTKKRCQKSILKHLVTFLLWTRSTDPWCNMLQTREREKYIGFILSDEHSLYRKNSRLLRSKI